MINDLQVSAGHLFAASDATGVLDIDISDPKTPTLTALYPNTVVMGPMAVNAKAIFVAGDKTVNSVSRLGDIALQRTPDSDIQLQLPAGLPMGNYQLSLVQPNGNKVVLEKTLSVKPAKRKKPKFTMDDFKKILEQQKLNKQKNAK